VAVEGRSRGVEHATARPHSLWQVDLRVEAEVLDLDYCQSARTHTGDFAGFAADEVPAHFDGMRARSEVRDVEVEAVGRERALDEIEAVRRARGRELGQEAEPDLHETLIVDHAVTAQLRDDGRGRSVHLDLHTQADVLFRDGRRRGHAVAREQPGHQRWRHHQRDATAARDLDADLRQAVAADAAGELPGIIGDRALCLVEARGEIAAALRERGRRESDQR